jgi:hypothetical protein
MKRHLKPIVAAITAFSCSTFAYATTTQAQVDNQLQNVSSQMQKLQKEMQQLQSQVKTLKAQKVQAQQNLRRAQYRSTSSTTGSRSPHKRSRMTPKKPKHPKVFSLDPQEVADKQYMPFGGSVIIAPFTGVPTYYNGHELLVNSPSINEDEKLLRRRDVADALLIKEGKPIPRNPRLTLSGALAGVGQYNKTYTGDDNSSIDLTQAELDMFVEVSRWVSGLMAFSYQNAPNTLLSANRVDNSRLVLDKGFITIGNFMKSAVYGSIGQMYVPFGRYSSGMVSSPLTQFIGQTKVRAINVGYHPAGRARPYAEAYVFSGAANNNYSRVENFGLDGGYKYSNGKFSFNLGGSYINQIADALGMQDNGLPSPFFKGFAQNTTTEKLKRNVPGGDIHAVLGYGPINFNVEFVTALRRFASENMTFNTKGARPSALNTEATFTFFMFDKPSSFTVNYGMSNQSLALGIPRYRYGATIEMAILRSTILSLEFRHDVNYGKGTTATGAELDAVPNTKALGKSDNAITAQLGVYF